MRLVPLQVYKDEKDRTGKLKNQWEGAVSKQEVAPIYCCAANYLQLLKSDYPQLNKEKSVGLFKI